MYAAYTFNATRTDTAYAQYEGSAMGEVTAERFARMASEAKKTIAWVTNPFGQIISVFEDGYLLLKGTDAPSVQQAAIGGELLLNGKEVY
jgi:hypothetical protein